MIIVFFFLFSFSSFWDLLYDSFVCHICYVVDSFERIPVLCVRILFSLPLSSIWLEVICWTIVKSNKLLSTNDQSHRFCRFLYLCRLVGHQCFFLSFLSSMHFYLCYLRCIGKYSKINFDTKIISLYVYLCNAYMSMFIRQCISIFRDYVCCVCCVCAVRLNLDDIIFTYALVVYKRIDSVTTIYNTIHTLTHMEANRCHSIYGENKFNDLF